MQSIAVKPAITVPLALQPIINHSYWHSYRHSYRQSSWQSSIGIHCHHSLGAIILSISRIKAAAAKRCLKKQDLS